MPIASAIGYCPINPENDPEYGSSFRRNRPTETPLPKGVIYGLNKALLLVSFMAVNATALFACGNQSWGLWLFLPSLFAVFGVVEYVENNPNRPWKASLIVLLILTLTLGGVVWQWPA